MSGRRWDALTVGLALMVVGNLLLIVSVLLRMCAE